MNGYSREMRPASPYRVPGERIRAVDPPPTSAATAPAEDNEAELTAVACEDNAREEAARLPEFVVFAIIVFLALALVVVTLLAGPR